MKLHIHIYRNSLFFSPLLTNLLVRNFLLFFCGEGDVRVVARLWGANFLEFVETSKKKEGEEEERLVRVRFLLEVPFVMELWGGQPCEKSVYC